MTSRFSCFSRFPRFLGAAAGTLVLLSSGQVFAATVVVAPAAVYARPPIVVTTAPKVVVARPPKVIVATAPLPRTVYVASRPVYVVR